jgi:hypothetical protein
MAGTSYTRQSSLTDGDTITASLFNDEYNQLVNAFAYAASGTTGHQHDGGAGEGGNIEIIGDQDFKNKIVVDSTNNRWSVFVEVGGTAVEQVRIEDGVVYPVTDSDVDLGTDAARFKAAYIDSITATTSLTLGTSITVSSILDEDDMASNSATALATQQSIKAYVDSQVTAQDLDVTDGTTSISIDLDSEALSVLGGTGIDSTASGNGVTLAIDSTVATLTGSQTLTNKTLTSPDVNTPDIDGGTIDGTIIGGTTAAAGSFTTVGATGNITVGGTVDGRDVATDGTKLDGIEAGATADQTDAEIRAAVEAATDSNVFTDADHSKLNAIEASADVTDTANVTAAGALMDSELTSIASVKALNQGVATTDSPTFAGATLTTADINAGTIDGTVIGGSTAAAGTFTTGQFNTSLNVDGTVTADKLITDSNVDAASFTSASSTYVDINNGTVTGRLQTISSDFFIGTATVGTSLAFKSGNGVERLRISSGGDISFYEDTGTTAKLFWDASAESLDLTGTGGLDVNTATGSVNIQAGNASADIALGVGSPSTANKVVVTAGGNVGIGTSSPSTALDVSGGTTNQVGIFRSTDATATVGFADNTTPLTGNLSYVTLGAVGNNMVFNTNLEERMRIDASGQLLLGRGANVASGAEATRIQFYNTASTYDIASIRSLVGAGQVNRGELSFALNNGAGQQERMRLDYSGNLLVGKTSFDSTTVGASLRPTGAGVFVASGGDTLLLNRLSSDGSIVDFRKNNTTVGSIGTEGGDLIIGTGTNCGLQFNDGNGAIRPFNMAGNSPVDSAVSLGISSSRFKDLYLSGGVYLGGTGAANHLDDYEEGTWTPVLADAVTAGNTATMTADGRYTKIGRLITVECQMLDIDTTGMTAGNNIFIRGLPEVVSVNSRAIGSVLLDRVNFTNYVVVVGGGSTSYALLSDQIDSAQDVVLTVAAITSTGSDITFTLQYTI